MTEHSSDLSQYAPVSAQQTATSLRGILSLIRRRRRFFFLTVASLLALCLLYCLIASNQYEAQALVSLGMQSNPSVSLAAVESVAPASILSAPLQLETIVDVLRSQRLAWRVIGELQLQRDPAFCPRCNARFPHLDLSAPGPEAENYLIDRFQRSLHARALPRTLLIQVGFRCRRAALSAQVVNRLIVDEMDEETRTRLDSTSRAADWLQTQLDSLNHEAAQNEKALADFEREHGILTSEQTLANGVSVEIARDPSAQQVDDLGRQLAAAEGDRIEREAIYREAQQGNPEQVLAANPAYQTLMASSGASLALQLETRRSDLTTQLAQWRTEHGPNFPQVVQLQRAIDELDRQIAAANASLLDGFRRLAQESADREKLLRAQWQSATDDSLQRNSLTLQDAVLRSRVLANHELITRLDAKIREARLNAGAHAASITVVDPARVPFKPVAPNLPLYLAITFVCALWIAFGGALMLDALAPSASRTLPLLFFAAALLATSTITHAQAPTPSTSGIPTGVVPEFPKDAPAIPPPNPKTAPPIWNPEATNAASASASPLNSSVTALGTPIALPIHAGDFLDVSEYHDPDFHSSVRVAADGTVTLPLIGSIRLLGMTETQAAAAIDKALVTDGMLTHPQATVLVTNAAGQDVSVLGEVARPGVYPYATHHRLLDLISAASGLTPTAGRLVVLYHRDSPQVPHNVILDPSGTDARTEHNPELEPGDTIQVSRAGLVYVIGDVVRPGGFAVDPTQQMTVVEALSLAWGATPNAVANKAILIRNQKGGRTLTTLNLKRMIRGQDPDVRVQDRDILYVPDSTAKNLWNKSLEAAVQSVIGVSLYAGLVYSQRF